MKIIKLCLTVVFVCFVQTESKAALDTISTTDERTLIVEIQSVTETQVVYYDTEGTDRVLRSIARRYVHSVGFNTRQNLGNMDSTSLKQISESSFAVRNVDSLRELAQIHIVPGVSTVNGVCVRVDYKFDSRKSGWQAWLQLGMYVGEELDQRLLYSAGMAYGYSNGIDLGFGFGTGGYGFSIMDEEPWEFGSGGPLFPSERKLLAESTALYALARTNVFGTIPEKIHHKDFAIVSELTFGFSIPVTEGRDSGHPVSFIAQLGFKLWVL